MFRECFHRTLADGWAYARFYTSETELREALPGWFHFYSHHGRHSAIGAAPISRLNNLTADDVPSDGPGPAEHVVGENEFDGTLSQAVLDVLKEPRFRVASQSSDSCAPLVWRSDIEE